MKTIDCRNMACPLPVVTVKRALEESEGGELLVLLDDGAPRENVTRFVRNRGYEVTRDCFGRTGSPSSSAAAAGRVGRAPRFRWLAGKRVLLVTSDRLGDGPEELGRLLMKNFIITLLESAELPDKMLFVNRGVLLATEGSELLEALEKLGNRGVEIFSCGVCLDFFGKREQLVAGPVTNMFSIVETLMAGSGVIRL